MMGLGTAAAAVLGASVAGLAAIWLGYPLLILAWARWWPQAWRRTPLRAPDEAWPRLSVIIAAHNESEHIQARVQNLLAQNYPASRLEIIISEDGSSDDTVARARAAAVRARVPVQVLSAAQRLGKAAAINRAAGLARGEVLVLTDANNRFRPDALRHLAAPFADVRVGAVTGRKGVAEACGLGGGEGAYWRYEGWLTACESAAGGTVAAFGEALALRRDLFRPLPTASLVNDDLYLALAVTRQGCRLVAAPQAGSWELGAADAAAEWERRRRMAAGRWGALLEARHAPGAWSVSDGFKILVHQCLRPASAIWALLALCSAPLLLVAGGVADAWRGLAMAVLVAFGWAAVVAAARALGWRLGRAEAPYFFCLALGAGAVGAWQRLGRGQAIPWRKVRRAVTKPAAAPHPPGIVNGLLWASSSFVMGKLFSFGSVLILARLLAPQVFGEVAIAMSAIVVLEIVGTLGLTSALVFEEQAVDAAANLCFWITMASSVLTMVAAWYLAPELAAFFHDPVLRPMVRALTVCLPIAALGNTHDFLLRRRLSFRTKFIPDIGQAAAKAVAAIALALLGWGAWSLIWGQLLGAGVATALLWQVTPWRPHRGFDRDVFWRMAHYAKHIYFLESSSVLLLNLDVLTIGRMLNEALVGFYTLAFRLPEVVLFSVLNVVTRVTFPGFSRLQGDLPRLRRTLLDTARYTALLTLPMAAGMGLLAPAVVFSLYGKQWGPSVAVVEVLVIYGAFRCMTHPFGDGYKAIGRPDVLTKTTIAWWLVLPPSVIVGARWDGIVGVAWAHVFSRICMSAFHIYLVAKYLHISPATIWRCYVPAMEGTAIMGITLWLARPLAQGWSPRLELVAMVPFGAAVYLAAIVCLHPHLAQAALLRLRRHQAPAAAASSATELAA